VLQVLTFYISNLAPLYFTTSFYLGFSLESSSSLPVVAAIAAILPARRLAIFQKRRPPAVQAPLAPNLVPLPPDENGTESLVFGEPGEDTIVGDPGGARIKRRGTHNDEDDAIETQEVKKKYRRTSAESGDGFHVLMEGNPVVWEDNTHDVVYD
jgi:hypothetical protein